VINQHGFGSALVGPWEHAEFAIHPRDIVAEHGVAHRIVPHQLSGLADDDRAHPGIEIARHHLALVLARKCIGNVDGMIESRHQGARQGQQRREGGTDNPACALFLAQPTCPPAP
jgi:hypothetical protein